jgi:hypothetical protein
VPVTSGIEAQTACELTDDAREAGLPGCAFIDMPEGLPYKLEAGSTDPEWRIALVLKHEGMGIVAGLPESQMHASQKKQWSWSQSAFGFCQRSHLKGKPPVPGSGAHCRIRYVRQRGDTAHGLLSRSESPGQKTRTLVLSETCLDTVPRFQGFSRCENASHRQSTRNNLTQSFHKHTALRAINRFLTPNINKSRREEVLWNRRPRRKSP